ncbi:MAG: XdhC/CoxI family protein [Deltaproteobacteria bacterium]
MQAVTEALLDLLRTGQAGALATVVQVSGSTPQVAGARLLLRADGSAVGTIGGGAIERAVLTALADVQQRGVAKLLSWDLGRDLGMCCGGSMGVFLEPIGATPRLWVCGAGHVAQPTAALGRSVGFELVIVDEREEWNTPERFPHCRRELGDPADVLRRAALGGRDWILITSHDHRLDEEVLQAALQTPARYIGLVGSRRKVYRLLQRITLRQGALDTTRLYAPVGLNLGALTPEEIAVSILSEIIALRHGVASLEHLRAVDDTRLAQLLSESAGAEDDREADR